MPVEMIVDPAGMGAVWRPPEGSAPHCADNAADHGTHRSGDHQAGPRTGGRADGIRLCTADRSKRYRENRDGSPKTVTHSRPPLAERKMRPDPALNMAKGGRFCARDFSAGLLRKHTSRLIAECSRNFRGNLELPKRRPCIFAGLGRKRPHGQCRGKARAAQSETRRKSENFLLVAQRGRHCPRGIVLPAQGSRRDKISHAELEEVAGYRHARESGIRCVPVRAAIDPWARHDRSRRISPHRRRIHSSGPGSQNRRRAKGFLGDGDHLEPAGGARGRKPLGRHVRAEAMMRRVAYGR